jgi:Tol biopolymer transport system component
VSGPATWRVDLDAQHSHSIIEEGALPVLSPKGDELLVQTPLDLVIVALDSNQRSRVAGYFGVWSPDGEALVVHTRPYGVVITPVAEDPGAWASPAEGGLTLVRGEEAQALTEKGGHPAWHPAGDRIVFEMPADDGPPRLVELSLDGLGLTPVADAGRNPVYHPSGAFIVYERDGSIFASDGETERDLGISGHEPRFDPRGAFLAVLIERESRRSRLVRDIALFRVEPN